MKRVQTGFTLIELLVAMVIFAMLAVAGWQIMDSISKSRDRANIQLNQLSQLDYAYLQLSQDFAQTVNRVAVPVGLSSANQPNQPNNTGLNLNTLTASNSATLPIKPTFNLTAQQVDFVRLANADPRFDPPLAIARVVYTIDNGRLIKQRFYQLNNPNETPSNGVLLSDLKDAQWTALTPKPVSNFPDAETIQTAKLAQAQNAIANTTMSSPNTTPNGITNRGNPANSNASQLDLTGYQQLPKGVELRFRYHDEPMVWRFALPSQAPNFVISPNHLANNPNSAASNGNPNQNNNTNNVNNTSGSNAGQNNAPQTPTTSNTNVGVIGRPEGDN